MSEESKEPTGPDWKLVHRDEEVSLLHHDKPIVGLEKVGSYMGEDGRMRLQVTVVPGSMQILRFNGEQQAGCVESRDAESQWQDAGHALKKTDDISRDILAKSGHRPLHR